jgi:hypothetical protein
LLVDGRAAADRLDRLLRLSKLAVEAGKLGSHQLFLHEQPLVLIRDGHKDARGKRRPRHQQQHPEH